QPNRLALQRTLQGENCNPCIRFKVLPIYQLDTVIAGFANRRRRQGSASVAFSFFLPVYGEKCPAGQ
ncbi:hypothetical protein, partial [Mesorhizobium sp. M1322]|uniref:hypothetical protein n=1 Tax=Mesorhizobium sp. M1322 TaxID=2957081 RepID=UPI003338D25B